MGPIDIIAILLIVLTVGGALIYIIRAKRRGDKCIGCPYAKQCGGRCGCHVFVSDNDDGNDADEGCGATDQSEN